MKARTFTVLAAAGTNHAAATDYYPSATGFDARGLERVGIEMVCSGGVTATIEEKNGAGTWVDVTKSFVSKVEATTAASYVDKTDILESGETQFNMLRVKLVFADASNGYYLRARGTGGNIQL